MNFGWMAVCFEDSNESFFFRQKESNGEKKERNLTI